jgi:serine/threonine-protein kinase
MTPEQYRRVGELYHSALELAPAACADFLAEACGDDEELRREVESLLRAHRQADGFIAGQMAGAVAELATQPQTSSLVGQSIGHYQVLSLLGAGGMGEVWLAEDTSLGRKAALKLLPPAFTRDVERVRRFEREARTVSALNHPNILTIYEIGVVEDTHFIATEFIEGQTLRERLRDGRLALPEALDLALQTASALGVAHEAGIIHRDIKPENVMVRRDGLVKVLDFGLAKLNEAPVLLANSSASTFEKLSTEPGAVMGTVAYMSPEQARGQKVDARSDLFSLGLMLYEMLAGQRPFAGLTTSETMAAILRDQPPPLPQHCAEASPELPQIVGKCLAKERAARYQSADELVAALKTLRLDRHSATAAPPRQPEAVKFTTWRRPLIAALVTVLVIGLIALLVSQRAFAPPSAQIKSLVVLPFKPLVAESHDEALELGLADTLITRLSGLRGLNVRPVEAVRKYTQAQTDALAAGREQQADAVLEGRFQRAADRFRVTARLVRVSDGTTIWAGKFDEQFTHLFAVQDGIAERVAEVLAPRLTGVEQQRLTKRPTESVPAYQLFQKGRHFWNKRGEANLKKAIAYFREALAADPNYAQAYAGMADCYMVLSNILSGNEVLPQAREYATKALALDASLAEAHTTLAAVKMNYDRDWAGAEREHQRALQLNPGFATGHQRYALYLMYVGRTEESLAEIKRALELDPVSLSINTSLGYRLHYARRYEQAIEHLYKTLELEPNRAQTRSRLGRVYESAGRYAEAIAEFQKARQLEDSAEILAALGCSLGFAGRSSEARAALTELQARARQQYISPFYFATLYIGLGDREQAFAWLNQAEAEHAAEMSGLKVNPLFDSLRADPRWQALLRRMNFPE